MNRAKKRRTLNPTHPPPTPPPTPLLYNYNIILLANDNSGNNIVYYSDFLGKYNVDDDDEFIEEFMESFKQIIVPITVEKIGTYHEDDKTYPLFISSTGERYIYIDGEIHTYKK